MKKLLRKSVSWLCLFAMLVSILPTSIFGAAGSSDTVSSGINGYQATMQADEATGSGYESAFGDHSAKYDGKVWADKSVALDVNDESFDVTLSALGQTFATKTTTTTEVAFDVVFVVDVSPSMNFGLNNDNVASVNNTRMMATVNALNSATDELMKNDNNRMGVVAFGERANNMVDLAHYDNAQFSYTRRGNLSSGSGTLSFSSDSGTKTQSIISATNPQSGLFNASTILTNASIPSGSPDRIPIVILLTDGEPNQSSSNYKTGNWNDGSVTAGRVTQDDYYYTICTAATINDQIEAAYKQKQPNSTNADKIKTGFYTIGLGLASGTDAETMLNPQKRDLNAENSQNSERNWTLDGTINYNAAGDMGFSTYDYVDGSYVGQMTADELKEIFDSIIGSITSTTGGSNVGESTGGRDKIAFVDTLGDGVTLDPQMNLSVPTYTTNGDQMVAGNTRTYNLIAYADSQQLTSAEAIENHLSTTGNVVTYRVANATGSDKYDQAAATQLLVTATKTTSGRIQIDYAIPADLMPYNVRIENNGQTDYFDDLGPIRLTYTARLASDADAGSYLIGAPAQTYMQFIPSSAQNDDGSYQMPYYWTDLGRKEGETAKSGTGIAGASNYITNTQVDENNNVKVYLGNNGLYKLTGKALTLNLTWDDANNQDGKRYDAVNVQLYKELVSTDRAENPTAVPDHAEQVGELVPLNSANVVDAKNTNLWRTTTDELPAYENGQFVRYWLKIDTAISDNSYTATVGSHGTQLGEWFCFDVAGGLRTNAELDITLSRTPETSKYTIEKKWDSSTGDAATTESSIDVQLYANGQAVMSDGVTTENATPFTVERDNNWKTTLNLPKYQNGQLAIYNFVEINNNDKNYTAITDYSDAENGNITITNYAPLDKTTLTVSKQWSDGNNQDGSRPSTVAVKLTATAGGAAMSDSDLQTLLGDQNSITQNLSATTGWECSWINLPKQTAAGADITYSAVETTQSEGYNVIYDATTIPNYVFITNSHTPETTSVTIEKTWNDGNNQDGLRPATVSGTLYKRVGDADQLTAVQSYTVNGTTATTINNLPGKEAGKTITYYVTEHPVNGYTLSVNGQQATTIGDITAYQVNDGKITLTNSHTPDTTSYTATFTWNDNDNRDGKRPTSFTVKLNGSTTSTLTVTTDVDGHITKVEGLPTGAKATMSGTGFTISGLPAQSGGQPITYTMSGVTIGNGYTSAITGVGAGSMDFSLNYSEQAITLGFTKIWEGDGDNADMRPSTETYANYLTLKAGNTTSYIRPTVTATTDGSYTVSYSGLDKYGDDGKEINYTVTERAVPNYTTTDATATLTADNSDTITNTFAREVYDKIEVTKEWNDADGTAARPDVATAIEGGEIDVRLYDRNDTDHAQGIKPASVKDNGNNTWTYTWENVPKTDADGREISYTAYEVTIPSGYVQLSERDSDRYADIYEGTARDEITNTLNTEATATGKLAIEKVWSDEGYSDQRGTVVLDVRGRIEGSNNTVSQRIQLAQENGKITATNLSNTNDTTVSYTEGKDGNSWGTVTLTLPLTQNGKTIAYYVDETTTPANYTPSYGGVSASNRVTLSSDETKTITVTNTYTPAASDEWHVTYDAHGGTTTVVDDKVYSKNDNTVTVKGQGDTAFDSHVFLGWSREQVPVVTTAEEATAAKAKVVDKTITINSDTTLYAIWAIDANKDDKPDYEQKYATVEVVWDDGGNACGIRPTSLPFTLNGESYTVDLADAAGVRISTAGENTMWIYDVPTAFDLDADLGELTVGDVKGSHSDGAEGSYTTAVTVNANTYTVTLTHEMETVDYSVSKTWDAGESGIDVSAAEATVQLLAGGEAVANSEITLTGDNTHTWSNLPKYAGGQAITYHAVETEAMTGAAATDDELSHFGVTYDWSDAAKTAIANAYSDTRNVTLLCNWDDNSNATGSRPESITVQLYNGDTAVGDPVTIEDDGSDTWETIWGDLPIEDEAGNIITYTAKVTSTIDGYESDEPAYYGINDNVIVINNTLENPTAEVTTTKSWNDAENKYSTRPESVYVNLLQDGLVYRTAELTADGSWQAEWTGLPVKNLAQNTDHVYTVEEIPVAGYTAAYNDDGTITNTLTSLEELEKEYTVTFVYDHASATDKDGQPIAENTAITVASGSDYQFTAAADSGYTLSRPVKSGSATLTLNDDDSWTLQNIKSDITVTLKATKNADSRPPIIIDNEPTEPEKPEDLNTEDHFSYIVGYPIDYRTGEATDNEDLWPVQPEGKITRAEVATIFYRLLKDEVRDKYDTAYNGFSDVDRDDWFNVTVSTLSNMDIVKGYDDGSFRPNAPITRAEFAAIATRFFEKTGATYEPGTFTDVNGSEWFAGAIQDAVDLGLIGGYPDGTMRPNNNISRAEACAIVNRTLGRVPDADHLLPTDEMKTWPDNKSNDWYYADIQEATNGHEYKWITEDKNKVEEWTKLLNKDWNDR